MDSCENIYIHGTLQYFKKIWVTIGAPPSSSSKLEKLNLDSKCLLANLGEGGTLFSPTSSFKQFLCCFYHITHFSETGYWRKVWRILMRRFLSLSVLAAADICGSVCLRTLKCILTVWWALQSGCWCLELHWNSRRKSPWRLANDCCLEYLMLLWFKVLSIFSPVQEE